MPQTKRDRLEQLRQQFDELTASLEARPRKPADRLKTREQIRRQMEDLEHIPPVPVGCYNFNLED